MKHVLTFGLVIASILSLVLLISTDVTSNIELKKTLEEAKKYEQEELYIKAIESYKNAVSLTDKNYKYKLAIIDNYEKLEDIDSAISLCQLLVKSDPKEEEAYNRLVRYYLQEEQYDQLIPFVEGASERFPKSDVIAQGKEKIESLYEVNNIGYSDISIAFNGQMLAWNDTREEECEKQYVLVETNGSQNRNVLNYSEVRFTDAPNQFIVKNAKGLWQVINEQQYPVAKSENSKIEDMGVLAQGCASVKTGAKYFLVNSKMKESKMSWDYVGTFSEGIAPVRIGQKWGLMSVKAISADNSICVYDEIATDELGRCCINDRIFVKENGSYYLINAKGKKIIDEGFEEVDVFASGQPAAVKKGGKWGFLSADGKMIIEPKFEEARSFSNGYAAIRQGDKWGVINQYGNVVVEPQFKQVKYATEHGVIPVQNETEKWDLIYMYKLYYRKS